MMNNNIKEELVLEKQKNKIDVHSIIQLGILMINSKACSIRYTFITRLILPMYDVRKETKDVKSDILFQFNKLTFTMQSLNVIFDGQLRLGNVTFRKRSPVVIPRIYMCDIADFSKRMVC